jgi:hypothetical protein
MESDCSAHKLPQTPLAQVFQRLAPRCLAMAALACRGWRDAAAPALGRQRLGKAQVGQVVGGPH